MSIEHWRKYFLYLIPLGALVLVLYYPVRVLWYDIQLQKEGVRTNALCVAHVWKEDADSEHDLIETNRFETAYPKVSFVHDDSTYFVDIDPYYYERDNGQLGYLVTGESVEVIYFPDDPSKRVVAVNSNAFFWQPLLYLVIFLGLTVLLFFWIRAEVRSL